MEVQKLWKKLYHWPDFPADGSQWDKLFADGDSFRIGELEARVRPLDAGDASSSAVFYVKII